MAPYVRQLVGWLVGRSVSHKGEGFTSIFQSELLFYIESNASSVLKKYNLEHRIPSSILQTLDECPYSCIYFKNITNHLIANNSLALKKAEYFSLKVRKFYFPTIYIFDTR